MPPTPKASGATGSLTIDQGAGPFNYGDTLTFTVADVSHMQGGWPMIEVALFQDADADSDVETGLMGGDLVWLTLNKPEQATIVLGSGGSGLDATKPCKGVTRLLRYAWKGKQESIDELDRVEFDAGP